MFLGFLVGVTLVVVILPFLMKKGRNIKALEKVDFMLPKTIGQRVTFFFIAITAGVCEEIIFREVVTTYVLLNIGVELPIWAIGVIGAVLFGLAHWYQGLSGIVTSGLIGYAMFNLYVQTGSLLVPMLVHFLIDVKFVFMPDWQKKRVFYRPKQQNHNMIFRLCLFLLGNHTYSLDLHLIFLNEEGKVCFRVNFKSLSYQRVNRVNQG